MKPVHRFAALLAVGVLLPFLGYEVFWMKVLCFALFACAFNLLLGFTGLLSFGHAAFFGGAAYFCGYADKQLGLTPELAVLFGAALAGCMGLAIGLVAIRRQGIYFAMITLAMAQMFYFFCVQAPFTGGEDGMQSIPRGRLFGLVDLQSDRGMYYFVLAVFLLSYLAIWRIVNSPFGQVLCAVKDNEARAVSLGYRVERYKLAAFVLSCAFAGAAGAMKALVFSFASLTDVHWAMSGTPVLATLLGGLGTFFGPVLGALMIVGLEVQLADISAALAQWTGIEWFNTMGDNVHIVIGIVFIACVLLFREGVIGRLTALLQRFGPSTPSVRPLSGAPRADCAGTV
jgi:branched-chain amino acid transport system permease protein